MLQSILDQFIAYFENGDFFGNEFAIAGVISAGFYSILSIVRDKIPMYWARIARLFIYTVTIEQSDGLYVVVSKWLADNYPKKLRNVEAYLKDSFGDGYDKLDDNEEEAPLLDGDVKFTHLSDYFYTIVSGRILRINKEREKLEHAENFRGAYMGRIEIKGLFARKAIKGMIEQAMKYQVQKADCEVRVFRYNGYWEQGYETVSKSLDKLYFPEKDELIGNVDRFAQSKELYKRRGIEWYFGLLLHGPAGTGKSSISKALAKYTKRNLYVINLASINDANFQVAFNSIGKNAILFIDDIDISMPDRDTKAKEGTVSLQTLLSSLDGSLSRGDLMFVCTTNEKSKLDYAFLRKGRIDLELEISYPDLHCVKEYLDNFYEADVDIAMLNKVRLNQSMADIQNVCLNNELDEAITLLSTNPAPHPYNNHVLSVNGSGGN